ncbi:hypothetical protein [Streptomyces lunalinharesii]|uniref:Uncharacterized protein n=1 Tax=Streptomyces lunalinharesii TaxID=333384 RepID=A0ABP6F9N3_9ACTN
MAATAESCSTVRQHEGNGSVVTGRDGNGAPPQQLRWAGRGDGGHAPLTTRHRTTDVARGPAVRDGGDRRHGERAAVTACVVAPAK